MGHSIRQAVAGLGLLIAAPSAMAQAPLLEFAFDEGSGTTAVNSGSLGAGSNGAVSGAVHSMESPFDTGFSMSFDGDTDYVELADTFDYGSALTLEAWIKPAAVDGQRAIYDDYGNPGVFMAISSGVLQFNLSTDTHFGLGISIFDGAICGGLWQHVAGTYDGTIMRAYVDGVEVGTVETSGGIYDNGSSVTHIGADSASPNVLEFAGLMDDLRLFPVALMPEELGDGVSLLLCGELNGDCQVTATDALSALRMGVGLNEVDPAADMNRNGLVSASDALKILRIAVGSDEHVSTCNG